MYTPYLMFAYAAALVLVVLGFGVVRSSIPGLRGLTHLRRYVLCALGAVILLGLRARVPLFLSEIIPNLVLFAGTLFLYRAITEILGVRSVLLARAGVCCAAAAPVIIWFTYIRNSELARLETHCAVLIAVLGISAATLYREPRPGLRAPARACARLLAASVVVNAAWAAYGLLSRRSPNFLHPDAVHAGFSYLVMLLTLGNVVALGWVSFCVHREQLNTLAQTDALTGLLNRGAFEDLLRRELHRCERDGQRISLILLDVDYFKQVNDEHGHLVGDDVLRRIGMVLRAGTRPSDVLARFGGEEFVILLRDAALRPAEQVAERLRADMAALDDLPRELSLTGSFGCAVSAPHETASELLARADEALYCSKREGRNLVRVDCGMHGIAAGSSVAIRG